MNFNLHNWKRYKTWTGHEWEKAHLKKRKKLNQNKKQNPLPKNPNNWPHFPIAFLMISVASQTLFMLFLGYHRNKLLGGKMAEEYFRKTKKRTSYKRFGETRMFVPHLLPTAATLTHCSYTAGMGLGRESTACNSLRETSSLWEHSSKGPTSLTPD